MENSLEPSTPVVLYDATPENSDTGDWQIPSVRPSVTAPGTSADGVDNLNTSVGTKKNRPGKISRDLHDLQEYVRVLSQHVSSKASIIQVKSALMEKIDRDEFHTLSDIVSRKADLAQVEAMRAEPIRDSDRGDFQGFDDRDSRTLDLDQAGLVDVHHEFQPCAAKSCYESTASQEEVAEIEATKKVYCGQVPTLTQEISIDANLAVVVEQGHATRAKCTTSGLFKWLGPMLSIASLCIVGRALSNQYQQELVIAQLLLQQEELTNQVNFLLNHDYGQGTSQSETKSAGHHFKKLRELEDSISYLYDQKAKEEVYIKQLKEQGDHITYLYSSKADKGALTEQLKEHSNYITHLYSSKSDTGAQTKELKEHRDLITYLYSSKADKGANAKELKEHSDHITHLYSSKADKEATAKELKAQSDHIAHLYSSKADKSVLGKLFKEDALPSCGVNSEAITFFGDSPPSCTSGKASFWDKVPRNDHVHRALMHTSGH